MSALATKKSLLIVSESQKLREVLRKIFQRSSSVNISGEARNITETLDILIRIQPDVVLLDMAMIPTGDMGLLKACMIHQPTPIIVMPSLFTVPLQHCFEALKNGAVDFVCKDSILKYLEVIAFEKYLVDKILCASKLDIQAFDPLVKTNQEVAGSAETKDVILFCEDCGARNIFQVTPGEEKMPRYCAQCGDLLENHLIQQHKRTHYITVIAAGTGSYTNILKIIPRIPAKMSGAIIIVIYDTGKSVDAFAEYLNTISPVQVLRMKNGLSIEGGNCYVAAADEYLCMNLRSANNVMGRVKEVQGSGPVDLLMQSITAVFKNKTAGLTLSGSELDGEQGINSIKENNGISAVLFSANCLQRQMGENILRKCRVDKIVDENNATLFISELHDAARDSVATA